MFKVHNLCAWYGKYQVLYDISLSMKDYSIISLLGPNGGGKSTFVKAICGLVAKKSDCLEFMGKDISKAASNDLARMGMAFVPEADIIFPTLSVIDHLRLGCYNISLSRKEFQKRCDDVFALFPSLADKTGRWAGTLSGGEQRMVAIARAMISKPKCLILDEPSFGIAPKLIQHIYRAIHQIKKNGVGILLIEQHTGMALSVSDEVYVINSGKVLIHEKAEKLLNDKALINAYLGQ